MFEVWAPDATRVDVEVNGTRNRMKSDNNGWWRAEVPGAGHGTDYAFCLDGREPLPDPRTRRQPQGVFGPTAICGATRSGTAATCAAA